MKTQGQIAYEAYCGHTDWKSLVSGAELPQWEQAKPEIRAAWEASAVALASAAANLVKAADHAITHFLDRLQTDPDVMHLCGEGTETFARFCEYEAARRGTDVETVRKHRAADLQPSYRRRDAEVLVLRKKLEDAGIE